MDKLKKSLKNSCIIERQWFAPFLNIILAILAPIGNVFRIKYWLNIKYYIDCKQIAKIKFKKIKFHWYLIKYFDLRQLKDENLLT